MTVRSLSGRKKGYVEGETEPLQTLEPEPEPTAGSKGIVPLNPARVAEAQRTNLLVRIACNRRSEVQVDKPFGEGWHGRADKDRCDERESEDH